MARPPLPRPPVSPPLTNGGPGLLAAVRSWFAWHTVRDTGVWLYQWNSVTRCRRIIETGRGGYQPVDVTWLEDGRWSDPPRRRST